VGARQHVARDGEVPPAVVDFQAPGPIGSQVPQHAPCVGRLTTLEKELHSGAGGGDLGIAVEPLHQILSPEESSIRVEAVVQVDPAIGVGLVEHEAYACQHLRSVKGPDGLFESAPSFGL